MENKGGPPDLDVVLKNLKRKIASHKPSKQQRPGRIEKINPFRKRDDDNSHVAMDGPVKANGRLYFLFFVIALAAFFFSTEFISSSLKGEELNASLQSVNTVENNPVLEPNPNALSSIEPSAETLSTDLTPAKPNLITEQKSGFLGGINMFESMGLALLLGAVFLFILFLRSFVRIVPQNEAFVVERLGKYDRTLLAGFNITIPVIERVAYKHSLKEFAVDVASQHAITRDNVVLGIDGVLYLKIMDARAASYGVENLNFAITQLAQTSMRAEIGKLSLDDTFESREVINSQVTRAIDEASEAWGTKVLRYEVKDITPPASILEEMEKQMGAERQRRVAVTTSEGYRQAQINQAEGDRQAQVLRAQGSAESMTIEATARAEAIGKISEAINAEGGSSAVAQQLAEQYVTAFDKLAREGTIALLPADSTDVASMVAKAYTAFDSLKGVTEANKSTTAANNTTFTGS